MELKDLSSMILEQINMELELMKNQNNFALKYKQWIKKEGEVFNKVNEKLSEKISNRYDTEIKQCYINCFRGLSEPGTKYFEGYVWSIDIPIALEHGFLVKDGQVIDPTLIISGKKLKKQQAKYIKKGLALPRENTGYRLGDEYLGVEIPKEWLYKQCVKTGKSGPHLFDYFMEKYENEND